MSIASLLKSIPDPEILREVNSLVRKYDLNDPMKNSLSIRECVSNPRDFFLLTYFMNAQSKSKEIELKIIETICGTPVPASIGRGDGLADGKYYELKTSTTNNGNFLNIRQIRPWQKIDYYICSYINELKLDKSKFYLLSEEEMRSEVNQIGGATHGTALANKSNSNIEYSISLPVYNDNIPSVARWNKNYWYNDLYETFTK